jgi:predicted nucleic acid-binding protein
MLSEKRGNLVESYVVDASVVAKWFNRGEEFENESDKLRIAWVNDEIQLEAPAFLPFEVANSIWKNPNVGTKKAGSLLRSLIEISPRLHDLEGTAEQAMSIARRRRVTFYDASYLALAKVRSLTLVTADSLQLKAASGYVKASHLSIWPKLAQG